MRDTTGGQALAGPAEADPVPVGELDLPFLDRDGDGWRYDPVAVVRDLHSQGWLARSDAGVEVLSFDVCRQMLQDQRARTAYLQWFVDVGAGGWVLKFVEDGLLPAIDGDKHLRIRRILKKGFAARRIDQERDSMRYVANRLIDSFIERGECDFVKDFSHWYPIEVVCRLIGVPAEDIPLFERWTVAMGHIVDHPLGSGFKEAEWGTRELAGYLGELVKDRNARPREDFVSKLIEVQQDEDRLTKDEMILGIANLLMAGQDTTRFQLGWAMNLLYQHHAQWQALRADPTLSLNTVHEAMRFHPSARTFVRRPSERMVYRGVAFDPSTVIRANIYAANHDPDVFTSPDDFDIRRPNADRQLTFGFGIHLCLGAALATAEMTVALEILASRLPDFAVSGRVEYGSAADGIGGVQSLPITFSSGPKAKERWQ